MNSPIHILFIEDNPGDARLVKEELHGANSRVTIQLEWVDRLETGMECLAANRPQAVLLDLNLPDSQGLETLRRVLDSVPSLPVIVMTGQADEELGICAMQAGAQDYLVKGQVDGNLLARAIQYAIQRKQTEMQLSDALEFTEHIVTSSPMGIFTYRLSGECLSANAAAARMVGGTIEQLRSQNFHHIDSWKRSGLYGLAEQAISSKKLVADDVHVLTSFDKEAWYRAQFVTFKSGEEELLLMMFEDITERKLAEEALRESEENYRQLFEAESDAILLIENQTGQILQANKAACSLYGYSQEELLDKKNFELSAEPEQTREVTQKTPIIPGQVISIPLRYHRRKDGMVFPVEITGRFFLHRGRPVHIAAIRDITQRKQAEAALEASEKRFRTWIENSSDIVTVIDSNGVIQYESASVKRLLGYAPEELLGQNAFVYIHPDDRDKTAALVLEGAQNPDTAPAVEFRFLHRNGSWRVLEAVGRTYVDEHGLVMGLINSRDITQRKILEKQLQQKEATLRSFYESAPSLMGITELVGEDDILHVYDNPATCRFFDVEIGTTQGRLGSELGAPPSALQEWIIRYRESERTGQPVHFEYLHQDGMTSKWLAVSVAVIQSDDPSHTRFCYVAEDISERKHAEAALKTSEQRYRELAENFPNGAVTVYNRDLAVVFDAGLELKNSGFTAEDFIGKHFTEIALPETWEIAKHHLLGAFEGRVSGYEASGLDGQHYSVNVAPLHDANGEINEILVVSQNITSLKNAQSSLREKERLLSEAQRIGHIGSWSYDIQADTIQFSDEMYRLLDVPPDEFSHSSEGFLALVYPSDRAAVSRWMLDIRNGMPAKEMGFRVFHGSGELRYIQCAGAINFDIDGTAKRFIGTMQDVTERRNAEMQIEQHIRHLTALNEIDRAIISSFDQKQTLDVILRQTISQLQLDAADVLLLDQNDSYLCYAAGRGFRTRLPEAARIRIGESYAGRVAKERHMIRIMDLSESVNDPPFNAFVRSEGFVSYIGVPLFVKGKVRGVLELYQRTPMHAYPDWLDFLYTLAGQTAIAIDNAAMFENLQRTNQELSQAYDATIEGWSRAMDLRDRETEGHTQRVTHLTLELARRMGVEEARLVHVRRGALLHDIGKLGVPDDILFKTEGLTPGEWEVMKRHPELAYEMLSPISYLKPALAIPYYHHERWDGSGYPIGLKGEQIPLEARIFAVVDVWDALHSDRPYRKAWDVEKVVEYITGQAGIHFDPRVVECFLKLVM